MQAVVDTDERPARTWSWTTTRAAARPVPPSGPTRTCGCYKGYVTSYVGFAPLDDPQLMTYVVINDPKPAIRAPGWRPRSSRI